MRLDYLPASIMLYTSTTIHRVLYTNPKSVPCWSETLNCLLGESPEEPSEDERAVQTVCDGRARNLSNRFTVIGKQDPHQVIASHPDTVWR